MVFSNNLLMGAAGQGGGYEIDQSIRFNVADSAYLTRTPGSAGNLKTWTYSVWFKRGAVGSGGFTLMGAGADNTNDTLFYFGPANEAGTLDIVFRESSTIGGRISSYSGFISGGRLFRDPSAWMHFVLVWDTTNATSADRLRLYINGERATTDAFSITEPSLNDESRWNTARANLIGKPRDDHTIYFDGYMADINFIDGTALTAASFGETNDDGVWIPKAYTNAAGYGTNGFYITGETAGDLGEDFSGNGNDFTSSGLATTDQMSDTPTNNYCVLSPIDKYSGVTLSDGNLVATAAGGWYHGRGTLFAPSGKWYYEWIPTAGSYAEAGWMLNVSGNDYVEEESDVATTFYRGIGGGNGFVIGSGATDSAVTNFALNDVIMMAIDVDTMKMWVGINGTWYNSGDPAAGTSPVGTWTAAIGESVAPWYGLFTSTSETFNFGQRPFAYTIPTGFNSWNTANLPTPTIADGSKYFDTKLWTGNDTDGRAITGYNFSPDLVWIKSRSGAYSHNITDTVRGVGNYIQSNSPDPEVDGPGAFGSTLAFTSDGFTLDNGTLDNLYVNAGSVTYAGWGWDANGAGSSNTDGATTSTVSANTTAGFSIVKWTGTGANTTLGHGLGAAPKMMLIKNLADADSWVVYHEDVGATKALTLDTTAAESTASTFFNDTAPTSSVFSVGSGGRSNGSSDGMIAYCFAEIPGYSSFGTYTGNASTDGTFIYTGFKPAFVLMKKTSGTGQWIMYDAARDPDNVVNKRLYPNASGAEDPHASNDHVDFVSNGFKQRSAGTYLNASGTYIYMAFAENPFGGDGAAPATAR